MLFYTQQTFMLILCFNVTLIAENIYDIITSINMFIYHKIKIIIHMLCITYHLQKKKKYY